MEDLLDPEVRARKPHWALHAWNGAGFLTLVRLAWHRSSEPWFLGVYSLPYFVFLVFSAAVLLYLSVLFNRFGARGFQILLTILGGALLCGLVAESAGQIFASSHPPYEVLAWKPDRAVGWKQVPGLRWP